MKLLAAAAIIALAAGVAGCGGGSSTQTQSQVPVAAPPPPAPPPVDPEIGLRPAEQVRLEALAKATDDADQHSTGVAATDQANFLKAYRAFCSAMQSTSGTLSGWTGHITGIYNRDPTTDTSTKAAVSLETPGGLKVFNYLDRGSGLMNVIRSLKVTDAVRFSIALSHRDDRGQIYTECQENAPGGPLVNKSLIGTVVSIAPLKS